MAYDTPTLKEVTDYLLKKLQNKYPQYNKKQIKTLFIEALCKNTVSEEINTTCEFIIERQPELLN